MNDSWRAFAIVLTTGIVIGAFAYVVLGADIRDLIAGMVVILVILSIGLIVNKLL